MIVICHSEETWLERHAAEELAQYLEEMTGKRPLLNTKKSLSSFENAEIFLIGDNDFASSVLGSRKEHLLEDLGEDGF